MFTYTKLPDGRIMIYNEASMVIVFVGNKEELEKFKEMTEKSLEENDDPYLEPELEDLLYVIEKALAVA